MLDQRRRCDWVVRAAGNRVSKPCLCSEESVENHNPNVLDDIARQDLANLEGFCFDLGNNTEGCSRSSAGEP